MSVFEMIAELWHTDFFFIIIIVSVFWVNVAAQAHESNMYGKHQRSDVSLMFETFLLRVFQ